MKRYLPKRRPILPAVLILATLTSGCWWQPEEPPEVELPYTPPGMKIVAAPALAPITPTVIVNGPRVSQRIALTFDACSTLRPSRYDERIAKVLVEMNVPATIFLGGKWMEEHPEHTRYLASVSQFELGNHSYLHPHMVREPDERLQQELKWTQNILFTLTGRQATLFRAPYGEIDERLVRFTAEAGLTTVQYDLASGDPDVRASKKKLIEYVTRNARNGSIVVMHINRRGWHTAEALPEIIARLRRRGYEFVTVGRLLADTPREDVTARR
jgi:peptidoglycan/xylan/chitin deacetylase (PgdA/CDA1 family)